MTHLSTPLDMPSTLPQLQTCGCPDLPVWGHLPDCPAEGGWRMRQTSDSLCSDLGCDHCREVIRAKLGMS